MKNHIFFLTLVLLSTFIYSATLHITTSDDLQTSSDQLTPGDTLYLAGGTYTIDTSWVLYNLQGTESNPIVITNEVDQTPIIEYDSLFDEFVYIDDAHGQNIITVGACSYLILDGLELTKGRTGIESFFGPNDHLTIKNMHIHNVGNNGMRFAPHIIDDSFEWEQHNLKFIHNHIHHTGVHGEGFYIGDTNGEGYNPENCQFINNWIHHTAAIDDPGNQGDGIQLKPGCKSCIIRNNVMHNTYYPCLCIDNTSYQDKHIIYNNFIINPDFDAGMQIEGGADVFNNIIVCHGGASRALTIRSGEKKVFNNTIVDGNVYRWNSPDIVYKNNIEAHYLFPNDDSLFQDYASNNYYPSSISPHIDAGENLVQLNELSQYDFIGTKRIGSWDNGAYEYNPDDTVNHGWLPLSENEPGFMDTSKTYTYLENFFKGFDNRQDIKISAKPNPFNPEVKISIKNITHAKLYNPLHKVFLGIYDIKGSLVKNLTEMLKSNSGKYVTWRPENIAAGKYMVKLIINNKQLSYKLTFIK